MHADIRAVLGAIGQSASLMFAGFVFMGFLQQRYTNTVSRYREVVQEYRSGRLDGRRHEVIGHEAGLYKRRCELMKLASDAALIAGMLLTFTLLAVAFNVMVPGWAVFRWIGVITLPAGLVLVIAACAFGIAENSLVQRIIDAETLDLSDLPGPTGPLDPGTGTAEPAQ